MDLPRPAPRRPIRPRMDFFLDLSESEFEQRFRLSKDDAHLLLEEIREELEYMDRRNDSVAPSVQLLITLRFFATGTYYNMIGDFIGLCKWTVWSIVHRVAAAIAQLRPRYIRFPSIPEEIRQAQADFFSKFGFPRVLGCIDCKHFQVKSFGGHEAELFRNRENYFSINVQVICNAHLEIIDVVARWPGSTHDSIIFENSRVKADFEEGRYGDGILLGDAGYPLLPYLLTPLADARSAPEYLYNESQIRTRGHIERVFGIWAKQWGIISGSRFKKFESTLVVIVAVAVLHNIACRRRFRRLGRIVADVGAYTRTVHNTFQINPALDTRRQIIDQYFQRLIFQ